MKKIAGQCPWKYYFDRFSDNCKWTSYESSSFIPYTCWYYGYYKTWSIVDFSSCYIKTIHKFTILLVSCLNMVEPLMKSVHHSLSIVSDMFKLKMIICWHFCKCGIDYWLKDKTCHVKIKIIQIILLYNNTY